MRVEFKNNSKGKELWEIYNRDRRLDRPKSTTKGFFFAVNFLRKAKCLDDVYKQTSLHFEKYSAGKYKGKHSVRCDQQFRLILDVETDPELILILEEIVDYH